MSAHSPSTSSRPRTTQLHSPASTHRITLTGHSHSRLPSRNKNPSTDFLNNDTTTNSPSSTSRSHSTHLTTQGVTVTRRSRVQSPSNKDTSEVSFEEGFSIFAFGDLSMSEAYNAPAPTTGEYPLRLKRTRPPKASKKHLQLQLQHGEDGGEDEDGGDMENILQHLYRPEHPLSPASDFKRFVEGLQSAKAVESPFLSSSKTVSSRVGLSKHGSQAQTRSGSVVDARAKDLKASRGSLVTPLQTGIPTLSPASDFTGIRSAHSKTASPALSRTTGASVSQRTNTQARPFAGVKTSMALQRDVDAKSSSVVSKAKARDRVTTGHSVLNAQA
ncbi:hypothetical protein BC629DRAFT_1458966 [Irpex lacteus]|nr:hypothetical protein BC629DRAFT_1458966 [Irpex lacteus]